MQINLINYNYQNVNFKNLQMKQLNKYSEATSNMINRDLFKSTIPKYKSKLKRVAIKIKHPKDISSIIIGKVGRIRSEKELKIDDIVKLINYRLKPFQEADIEKILKNYSQEDQELAKKILIRCTQFGKIDALKKIAEGIGGTLYQDGFPSCATTMRYMQKYKHFQGVFNDSNESGAVIVDKMLLERLENDPEYLQSFLSNPKLDFVLPEGYITGINPFTQTQDFKKLLDEKMKQFKYIQAQNPTKTEDEIISIILNQPILERLNKLGIKIDRVRIIQNLPETVKYNVEDILKQLNSKNITKSDIEKVLATFDEKDRPYILENLAQTLNVKSSRTCGENMKQIYKNIIRANGGTDEGIYYLLPMRTFKSFSTVLMQFCEVNNIDPSKIVEYDDLAKPKIKNAKAIVVLDDVAGSGESLELVYKELAEHLVKSKNEASDIIIAPLICTKEAFPLLDNISLLGRNVTCIPGEIVESFSKNSHVRSLPRSEQDIYKRICGGGGYEGGSYSLAFPYMSPDNNSALFSTSFASLFTLDGLGVKRKGKKEKQI